MTASERIVSFWVCFLIRLTEVGRTILNLAHAGLQIIQRQVTDLLFETTEVHIEVKIESVPVEVFGRLSSR